MKTVEEIILYLETELEEAQEMHDATKGRNAQQSLSYLIKYYTIEQLLEEIKK